MTPSEQISHILSDLANASVAVDGCERLDDVSWRIACLEREIEVTASLSEDEATLTFESSLDSVGEDEAEKAMEVMLVLNNEARDLFGACFGLTESNQPVLQLRVAVATIDAPALQRRIEAFAARAAAWRVLSQTGFVSDDTPPESVQPLFDPSMMA